MGFYQNQIVPILTDLAMRQENLAAYRSRVVPAADGRVLEIGVGSGRNLPFYSPNVRHLIGLIHPLNCSRWRVEIRHRILFP